MLNASAAASDPSKIGTGGGELISYFAPQSGHLIVFSVRMKTTSFSHCGQKAREFITQLGPRIKSKLA